MSPLQRLWSQPVLFGDRFVRALRIYLRWPPGAA
jgi:hypothetical protein